MCDRSERILVWLRLAVCHVTLAVTISVWRRVGGVQQRRNLAAFLYAAKLTKVCLTSVSPCRSGRFDATTLAGGFAACASGGPVWSPAFAGIE